MAVTTEADFNPPLTVADAVGNIEIGSAQDALAYLETVEWPDSNIQEQARQAAQGVLDGRLSASDAREAIATAAERVGVLIFS